MPVTAPPVPRPRTKPVSAHASVPLRAEVIQVNRKQRTVKCQSGQWNGAFLHELEEHLVRKAGSRTSTILQSVQLDEEPPAGLLSNKQTAVQKLAETSQMLKHAVVNLINYQDDANLASKAIPELQTLLTDDDPATQTHCLQLILQLSRKEASRHALMQAPQLIGQLVRMVNDQENHGDLIRLTSAILHQLSQHRQGLLVIFKTGGINTLVKMLGSPNEGVVMNAIRALHNLLLHQEGSKMAVRLSGGLQKMVSLLARSNQKLLTLVTDCLQMLAYGNQEGKLIILASGGPQELVRIMSTYSYEKLLWTTSRVLKVLSVCPSSKPAIVQAGGLQALAPHVRNGSSRVQLNTLYTLRNLSDEATAGHSQIGPLLRQLLECLSGNLNSVDDNERLCTAAGALSNLTCNNPAHKQALVQAGAVGVLLQLLKNQPERVALFEPVLCTLRHLCQRHPDAEQAAAVLRQQKPLNQISRLLVSTNWCIVRATVQLIRALALDASAHPSLRDVGVTQKLISLLVKTVAELRRLRPPTMPTGNGMDSALVSSALSGIQADGVPLLALLEAIVGALQLMARDASARDSIRSSVDVIPLLVQLLYGDVEQVQRVAVGLLCELANEKEGADKIEIQGASVPLTNLLNSRNEAIAAYSAAVLFKLSDDKSSDYKKQLTSELSNSLYRSDGGLGTNGPSQTGTLGPSQANAWTLPVAGPPNASNDLDLGGLLFHSQFATLTQSMMGASGAGPVGPPGNGIYQGVYATQALPDQLQNPYSLDPMSLSAAAAANNFSNYGQIGAPLDQPMAQPVSTNNMPNNGWLI